MLRELTSLQNCYGYTQPEVIWQFLTCQLGDSRFECGPLGSWAGTRKGGFGPGSRRARPEPGSSKRGLIADERQASLGVAEKNGFPPACTLTAGVENTTLLTQDR